MNTQSPLGKQGTNWATALVEGLERGEIVTTRRSSKSMEPLLPAGSLCTIRPHDGRVTAEDIVLVTCADNTYLHRVGVVIRIGNVSHFQIQNLSGRSNGWVTLDKIHGVLTLVEP